MKKISSNEKELVIDNLELTRIISNQMWRKIGGFSHFGFEKSDIENEAVLGLLQAANRFDGSKGIQFTTYATTRISGAILDFVRRMVKGRKKVGYKKVELTEAMRDNASDFSLRQLAFKLALERVYPISVRNIVKLHYLEGVSGEELAIRYEMSIDRVYYYLNVGRERLRDVIRDKN